jgi:hypothetical protein
LRPTLAHGSGIDDLIVFVVLAGGSILALRAAERKARRRAETEQSVGEREGSLSSADDE